MKRALSTFMFVLLLVSTLAFSFNLQSVKASGTIYIRADGNVDPPTAPIQRDGDLYTLTDNITSGSDGIVIERDNIVVDGRGYTVEGTGSGKGMDLSDRSNVTVKNTKITNFWSGIYLSISSGNTVSGNNVAANQYGIYLLSSSDNTLSDNTVEDNSNGISLSNSSDNTFSDNSIIGNLVCGIFLRPSSNNNTLSDNNVTNNNYGIFFSAVSAVDNRIFHNNFIDNTRQVVFYEQSSINIFDDGYPSGGNYWSDYRGADGNGDGIGDTPYTIDAYNRDRCPLMKPWGSTSPPVGNCFVPYKIKVKFAVNDVREMVLDEYLKGVVAAEMSSGWPIEALKAQAVAARTVAVRTTQHNHVKEDVCTDPAHCQAWKPPPYNQDIENAVSQTHNEVITYYGWILKNAMFFAWCNGHTIDSEDKPGLNSKPYLRGVSCSGQKCMQYRAMYNPETCPYLTYGNDISKCNCGLFDEHDPGAGGYYGHRVGMCQEGAKTMAQNGYGYVDIIKHYYTDVDVVTAVTAESRIIAKPQSPVELSISDSQNRVTGLANGSIKSEIPNSEYDEESELVTLFVSNDSYRYTVAGIDLGLYGLIVASATEQGTTVFESDSIPIKANATHQYTIDWDALSRGEEGVTVQVDSDGDGAYEHTFFSGAVLTGDEFTMAMGGPVVESCNSTGTVKDSFDLGDSVYVKGEGYSPSATYDLYVVNATAWSDGKPIPQRIQGTATTITSDVSGNITVTLVWSSPIAFGNYDIVVDVNRDGYYNSSIDALDQSNIQIKAGLLVIPEYWLGTVLGLVACLAAFGLYQLPKRTRRLGPRRSGCSFSKTGMSLSASRNHRSL